MPRPVGAENRVTASNQRVRGPGRPRSHRPQPAQHDLPLAGSLLSALLATVVLRIRNRHYHRLEAEADRDSDVGGVPDI